MNSIFEILKYCLALIVVLTGIYYILRAFFKNEQIRREYELKKFSHKIITPRRLQAYERMTLFLERISPDKLIMRLQKPNMTARQLQKEMLNTIRNEFEHNLAQQIYISHPTWEVIKNTKENITKLINSCADNIKDDAPSIQLSTKILQAFINIKKSPVDTALECIRKDMDVLF